MVIKQGLFRKRHRKEDPRRYSYETEGKKTERDQDTESKKDVIMTYCTVSQLQWDKIIYSKMWAEALNGDLMDSVYLDYRDNYEDLVKKYVPAQEKNNDKSRGFFGFYEIDLNKDETPIQKDIEFEVTTKRPFSYYIKRQWFKKNPGIASYMIIPTMEGKKMIDIDINPHIPNILGKKATAKFTELYDAIVKMNLKDLTITKYPENHFRPYYELLLDCREKIQGYFDMKGPVCFSGGGFQLYDDHKKYLEDSDYIKDGAVDPSNKEVVRFERFFSPKMNSSHLTTSFDLENGYDMFLHCNPSFFKMTRNDVDIRLVENFSKTYRGRFIAWVQNDLYSMLEKYIEPYIIARYMRLNILREAGFKQKKHKMWREFDVLEHATEYLNEVSVSGRKKTSKKYFGRGS